MLRPSVILPIILATSWAVAADCPPVPKLTCEQLLERAAERCPQVAATTPAVVAPRDAAPIQPAKKPEPIVETRYIAIATAEEIPRGNWLVGGGPIFNAGWGLQAFAGYQWSNGVQLQIGPNWIPRDANLGTTQCRCDLVQCTAPAPNQWGGAASIAYKFK